MSKKWKTVTLALTAAIFVILLLVATFTDQFTMTKSLQDERELKGGSAQLNERELAIKHLESSSSVNDEPGVASPANADQQLSLARMEFDEATSALVLAEREFDALEAELEEAENYVDKLQREGEDPAKYAEEGMLLLRPVIEKYETRLAIVEAAEARVELARQRVSEMEENMSGEK